ncbi:MAG: hypothetical protein GF346_13010 [Candidatus Eisenbacteria bacterium]|nr:hypothetical protein [Candidatus Latescibacterota bacterium]MBD3303358.1 hypothetical protein [Candidatus Eisenbacteria bacterium]
MNRRITGALLALLLMMPLCLVSCSDDDDDNPTGPGEGEVEVPEIPQAEINTQADFQSNDQSAQQAQAVVQGQLSAAQGVANSSFAYLSPLQQAQWTESGGDCASWSYTQDGCTLTYEVCETATGYEWSYTLDGDCADGEPAYDNWVVWSGVTNLDGTNGTFRWFEEYTTTVGGGWQWSYNPDQNSGNWSFYTGEISAENVTAMMDWLENQDGSQVVTWTNPGQMKWETTISSNGRVGTMESYEWVVLGQTWRLQSEIDWDNGTGSWTTYDDDGTPINEMSW